MTQLSHMALGAGLSCLAGTMAAFAQAPAGLPVSDPTSIWTLQDENSSISSADLTDRYYVNGLRLGYASGTESLPSFLQQLGHAVFGDGRQRLTIDISQQIFTAADTATYDPPLDDRPYAGLLMANVGIVQDSASSRSTLGLGIGVVGPSALAQSVQNGFHDIIGQGTTNGWGTQLHDEPVFEFSGSRVWRVPSGAVAGLQTDILPGASVGLGTVRVYAEAGAQFRLGSGLGSDFGAPRLRPGPSGGDAFVPVQPFAWYVFGGVSGQAVATDITLNGNTWQDSRSVTLTPLVGEFQAGLAIMAWGMRLSYTQVFQTQEFKHQTGGLHQFGSLALSVRF